MKNKPTAKKKTSVRASSSSQKRNAPTERQTTSPPSPAPGPTISGDCEGCRSDSCSLFKSFQGTSLWSGYLQSRSLRTIKPHKTLFHENGEAETIYLLIKGSVKLSFAGYLWTRRIVRILNGDKNPCAIMDPATITQPFYSMTCETLTPCEVCLLSRESFSYLMTQEPDFTRRILEIMSEEVLHGTAEFREEITLPARDRLARTLLRLGASYGIVTDKGTQISLTLTRQELANLVGISKETLIRLLRELYKEGMVHLDGKHIILLTGNHLQALASQTLPFPKQHQP